MRPNLPQPLRIISYVLVTQYKYRAKYYTDHPDNLEFESTDTTLPTHIIIFDLANQVSDFENLEYHIATLKNLALLELERSKIEIMMQGVISSAKYLTKA